MICSELSSSSLQGPSIRSAQTHRASARRLAAARHPATPASSRQNIAADHDDLQTDALLSPFHFQFCAPAGRRQRAPAELSAFTSGANSLCYALNEISPIAASTLEYRRRSPFKSAGRRVTPLVRHLRLERSRCAICNWSPR